MTCSIWSSVVNGWADTLSRVYGCLYSIYSYSFSQCFVVIEPLTTLVDGHLITDFRLLNLLVPIPVNVRRLAATQNDFADEVFVRHENLCSHD